MLPQWHVKEPGHFAKSAGDRLHLNTHTPLTQRSRTGLIMPLAGIVWEPIGKRAHTQLVKNFRPQSSPLAKPLWTDSGIKSGISVQELIALQTNQHRWGNEWSNILSKTSQARKKPPHPAMLSSCGLCPVVGRMCEEQISTFIAFILYPPYKV